MNDLSITRFEWKIEYAIGQRIPIPFGNTEKEYSQSKRKHEIELQNLF